MLFTVNRMYTVCLLAAESARSCVPKEGIVSGTDEEGR